MIPISTSTAILAFNLSSVDLTFYQLQNKVSAFLRLLKIDLHMRGVLSANFRNFFFFSARATCFTETRFLFNGGGVSKKFTNRIRTASEETFIHDDDDDFYFQSFFSKGHCQWARGNKIDLSNGFFFFFVMDCKLIYHCRAPRHFLQTYRAGRIPINFDLKHCVGKDKIIKSKAFV